jgi:hypothetical protein
MTHRALLLAVALVQCGGSPAPVPSPAGAPASAAATGKDTAPGPPVGATLPAFAAPDQDGKPQTFDTLRGPNGLLLNFNRSVVW